VLPWSVLALTATVYSFEIELAHVDRGIYESLAFRVAQHPSETDDALLTRVLAFCLEYTTGIQFSSQGLSEPDEPPISVRDATGAIRAWIDVGVPDAARLHKASKVSPRVAVYTHKDPMRLLRLLEGERVHRRDALEIYAVDRDFLAAWVAQLTRRMKFDLSISDGQIYVVLDEATLTGTVTPLTGSGRTS
jgi:uncharacterized protein YaeQ